MLYFTHDYLAMTPDKNNYLKASASLAQKHGAKRMVAVCPIELELYHSEADGKTPIDLRDEAQALAL